MNPRLARLIFVLILLVGLLVLSALPVFAGSASVSGSLAPGDPTMPVVIISTPNCTSQGVFPTRYDAIPFTVDAAGLYTLDVAGDRSLMAMYLMTAAFNPGAGFPTCLAADNAYLSITYSLAANTTYIAVLVADTFEQLSASYTLTISGPGNVYFGGPGSGGSIEDGRLNKFDLAAPYAVYCTSNGVEVWAIDNEGEGTLAFTASEAADASAANALVTSGMGISLYKLTSGEMQLVGAPDFEGKVYTVLFDAFPCSLVDTELN